MWEEFHKILTERVEQGQFCLFMIAMGRSPWAVATSSNVLMFQEIA